MEKGKEKEGEEIEKLFKQERERLEKKENEQEKLSEEEDEKLQLFKVCDQQAIHLSDVGVYTKEDLILDSTRRALAIDSSLGLLK